MTDADRQIRVDKLAESLRAPRACDCCDEMVIYRCDWYSAVSRRHVYVCGACYEMLSKKREPLAWQEMDGVVVEHTATVDGNGEGMDTSGGPGSSSAE